MPNNRTETGSHTLRRVKFKNAGTGPRTFKFENNQTWVPSANQGPVRFVDQGAAIRLRAALDKNGTQTNFERQIVDFRPGNGSMKHNWVEENRTKPRWDDDLLSRPSTALLLSDPESPVSVRNAVGHDPSYFHSTASTSRSSQRAAESSKLLSDTDLKVARMTPNNHFEWPAIFTASQSACLMHLFMEVLAPLSDIGDPLRHFSNEAPQRTQACPTLLKSVLTSAAIMMVSLPRYKAEDGRHCYKGLALPTFNHETVIKHHNECVTDLISLCNDSTCLQDENLLAALVCLRHYEERDAFFTREDSERLLHMLRLFLDAQTKTILQSLRQNEDQTELRSVLKVPPKQIVAYFKSFRHASFRIALRQELTAAYLTQRPVRCPLGLWALLDDLPISYNEDFIWCDRNLLHCARVLDLCYCMHDEPAEKVMKEWKELKEYQRLWETKKPKNFLPLLEEQPDKDRGQIFYRVWSLSDLHLTAAQFLDLSCILLAVHDPTIPRLGPNAMAMRVQISSHVRDLVLHLCSIALSYPDLTPAHVQAGMAVVSCAAYFDNVDEQNALLNFLEDMERVHGWPASHHAASLRRQWNGYT